MKSVQKRVFPPALALASAFLCFASQWCPQSVFGHGAPADTVSYDAGIVIDSQFVEITADLDLPTGLALDLRNQLDSNGDYQVMTPDEQQKLLWLMQEGEGQVQLRIDGKTVVLAPLYNPRMKISIHDSAQLEGRGKLRISWFGYTPEGVEKGSVVEFGHQLWSDVAANFHVKIGGRDGLVFEAGGTIEKSFKPGEKRHFEFTARSGIDKKAAAESKKRAERSAGSETMVPANAVQLAEALTLNYSYLVADNQRESVADVHRRLRMGIQKIQDGGWQNAGNLKTLNQSATEMVGILEKCESVVRIDMEKDDSLQELVRSVELPGDAGALLIRLGNGAGIHHGRLYRHSFNAGEFSPPPWTPG